MATFLYRVGRFAYRSRRLVGLAWLAIVIAVGSAAALMSGPTSDSFSIPGTESQQAFDLLDERFPGVSADGASARVVFEAPERHTLGEPAVEGAVLDVLDELAAAPQVAHVVGPYDSGLVSADGTIGLAEVGYDVDFFEMDESAREALFDAAETGRDAGLTVEIGGDAAIPEDEFGSELVGIGVAAVVLVVTFGSLAAAGMPLITGITGVGVGIGAIIAASGFLEIGSTAPVLATMLGLAVGIDYALFIVSRYRHELAAGQTGDEAAGRAVGTAGSAVVFAGLTVMIALVGLAVAGVPILTEMGLAAALTVGVAVLIALTLLPALLGFAGHRVLNWRVPGLRTPDPEDDSGTRPTLGHRWAGLIGRRPFTVMVAAVVGLGVLAVPVAGLRLGLPDDGYYPEDWTQRKAYDLTAEGFGPGFNGPLTVVVDASSADEPQESVAAVHDELAAAEGVQLAAPPQFNPDGDTAIVTVVPTSAPSSEETAALVELIRSDVADAGEQAGADAVLVTGATAVFIDFSDKMADALLPYLLVVVGLSVILLMFVFRSIVVPVKAALGFLLTIAATFGVVVAIFQWGWLTDLLGIDQTGPIFSILPIFIIGVVFGLAMDYEVFLVTRMREEYVHGRDARTAVAVGFGHGARVVAAAAIIMISVFAGFALGDADDVAQVGIALAAAIAFDAFLVRMTIVPAVLTLAGDRAWWLPRWLDRVLPDMDVDGQRLARHLDRHSPEREAVTVR